MAIAQPPSGELAKMKLRTIGLALLAFADAVAAQPSELYRCATVTGPDCGGNGFGFHDTCASFRVYNGRRLWYPLKHVGPITIELETLNGDLPLYVEIVPIPDSLMQSACALPGYVVAVAHGIQACGGGWETFGPFDIRSIVPLGGTYGLQIEAFEINDGSYSFISPGVDCIRVTTAPSPVKGTSWGLVKSLYK